MEVMENISTVSLQTLINEVVAKDASDLHLSAGQPPRMRCRGDMVTMDHASLTSETISQMLTGVMTNIQREEFARLTEFDFAISFAGGIRFRVNSFNTHNGLSAVFRTIPTEIRSLDSLGTPAIVQELLHKHQGLIVVTGPTGSGKTTTLAAMVDYINKTHQHHILTIEDPIEYIHQSQNSLINQRELGTSCTSFNLALKSALRQDPDIILVGELRDLETIRLALTAAETGHLVFATLHTCSAPKTIDRIIDVFPSAEKEIVRTMLSNSLEAVIAQCLLKTDNGVGRVAGYEIMIANAAIRNLIRENRISQIYSIMQVGTKFGMQIMEDDIMDKVNSGIICRQAAIDYLGEENHFTPR